METEKHTNTKTHITTNPDDWSDAPRTPNHRVADFVNKEKSAHENPKGCAGRLASIVIGIIMVIIGIPMLICPGPGILMIGAGFAMILAGLGLRKEEETNKTT